MLTYETIRKIIDEEKANTKLTRIPDSFFVDARSYLDKKAKSDADEAWRMESARRRFQDIIDIRERKVVNGAVQFVRSGVMPENMIKDEKGLFSSVVSDIKAFRQMVEKSIDTADAEEVVAMLADLDEFVGVNLRAYGPYKVGDVATVPKPVAALLVEKRVAERIDIKESAAR